MNGETPATQPEHNAQEQAKHPARFLHMALPFSERRALLIVVDALLVNGAVLAALRLWAWAGGRAFNADFAQARWFWFPLLTAAWWSLAALGDLYDVRFANRRPEAVWRVVLVVMGLAAVYLAVYFLLPRNALPRLFFLFFCAIALTSVALWRWAYATAFALPALCRRILIAGAGWAGHALAQALSGQESADYQVVGFVDDDPAKQGAEIAGLPVLGSSADLRALVRTYHVDEVVLAITHGMHGELFQALMDCRAAGTPVTRMPDLYEQLTRRVPVEHVNEGWVLDALSGFSALTHLGRAGKRLLDLLCGLLGLVGLGFLTPLATLAIRLDDGGPVLYTQVRAGVDGKPFRIVKFRTMRSDAEGDGHARWAQRNDARVTRVGQLLRRARLDELPQVINVLRGEMSIVGPRPERPELIADLEQQIPFYRTRLIVRPGLTGWAQIHYGYGSSVEDALAKLQYDLYYIRHHSVWLDLYVILRTIGAVLRGRGV